MAKRKYGFVILMAAVYAVLSLLLLVFFTGAKYTDKRTAYASFEGAQFNAAILLGETQNQNQETLPVDLTHLRPGLEEEDALHIPFRVANGPDSDNTAQVGLKYTIQVRTARNLPLMFSLEHTAPDPNDPTKTVKTLYTAAEPVAVESAEENSQDWYEYTFFLDTSVPTDPTDPSEPAQVTPLSGTQSQAEFLLAPDTLGDFVSNDHCLVVRWPVNKETDLQYIKEVEAIHIQVTAHSLNRLEEEDYIPNTLPVLPAGDSYTPGIVLLKDGVQEFAYTIDLRAFHQDANLPSRTFRFYMDNGVGQNQFQSRDATDYTAQLKVPLKKTQDGQMVYQNLALNYTLDGTANLTLSHYLIYNEKTDLPRKDAAGEVITYATLADVQAADVQAEERPYAIYTGISGSLMNYQIDAAGGKTLLASRNLHTLTISGEDLYRITDNALSDSYSFLYKLELLIETQYRDALQQMQPSTTATDETTPEPTGPVT